MEVKLLLPRRNLSYCAVVPRQASHESSSRMAIETQIERITGFCGTQRGLSEGNRFVVPLRRMSHHGFSIMGRVQSACSVSQEMLGRLLRLQLLSRCHATVALDQNRSAGADDCRPAAKSLLHQERVSLRNAFSFSDSAKKQTAAQALIQVGPYRKGRPSGWSRH
jgi:hypothetical protein